MNDDAWNTFLNTGSVLDYLKYKNKDYDFSEEKAEINGYINQGLSNQGTDYRGE